MGRIYRGARPEERSAQRRERLLGAGIELFGSHGYEATKIEQICAEAAVSTRNFYEHFRNKEALLAETHDIAHSRVLNSVGDVRHTLAEPDPLTRLRALAKAAFVVMTMDPRLPRIVFVECQGVSEEINQRYQRYVRTWVELIDVELTESAEHGLIPEHDYRLTAVAIVSMVTGLLRYWQENDLEVEPIADKIEELLTAITAPQR